MHSHPTSLNVEQYISYGTVDGKVAPDLWKIRLLDGSDIRLHSRFVYRVSPWMGCHTDRVANAALRAASATREAATAASLAAISVLRSPTTTRGDASVQLALAAASTAMTAASAATAAATTLLGPILSTQMTYASSAMTGVAAGCTQREWAPPCEAVIGLQGLYNGRFDAPLTAHATLESVYSAVAAAETASTEAAVATHAAGTLCPLPITARTVHTTAAVAQELMIAAGQMQASERTAHHMPPSWQLASPHASHAPSQVAAEAISVIGVAQKELASAYWAESHMERSAVELLPSDLLAALDAPSERQITKPHRSRSHF